MTDWLPQLTSIDDPVADDWWSYEMPDGSQRVSRVTIGRPTPLPNDPNGDWFCPLYFERFTEGIECVMGIGPVDALANAMRFVIARCDELKKVTPRSPVRTP